LATYSAQRQAREEVGQQAAQHQALLATLHVKSSFASAPAAEQPEPEPAEEPEEELLASSTSCADKPSMQQGKMEVEAERRLTRSATAKRAQHTTKGAPDSKKSKWTVSGNLPESAFPIA
jgi:hypothetical protein